MNRIVGLVALAVAILLAALAISKRNTAPTELEPVAVAERETVVAVVPAEIAVIETVVAPVAPVQEVAPESVDSDEDEDEETEQQN